MRSDLQRHYDQGGHPEAVEAIFNTSKTHSIGDGMPNHVIK